MKVGAKYCTLACFTKKHLIVSEKEGWLYSFFLLMWLCSFVYINALRGRLVYFRHQRHGSLCQKHFWCFFRFTHRWEFLSNDHNKYLSWLPLWRMPGPCRSRRPCCCGSGWRGWGWPWWRPWLGALRPLCCTGWTGCGPQEPPGSRGTAEVLRDTTQYVHDELSLDSRKEIIIASCIHLKLPTVWLCITLYYFLICLNFPPFCSDLPLINA